MAHVGQKRAWSETREEGLLAQLCNGVEGSTVLKDLVQQNGKTYSLASLSTMVSNLRSKFIKTGHKSIDCYNSSLALRKFAHLEAEEDATEAKAVAEFFGTTLEAQLEFQRGEAPGWSTGARDALAAVRLLPPNMNTFKLTHEQNTELKRKQAEGLERKTSTVRVVATVDLLLDEAKAVLDSANKADMLTLIVAVMVVTGRRTAEITNGHSTFTEVPGQDHHAQFTGQLKTRGNAKPYTIPILVPFETLVKGFAAMQLMQRNEKLPNDKAKGKYQSILSKALYNHRVLENMPSRLKPHDLRSIYAAIVVSVFAHGQLTIPGVVERILGHGNVNQSLHYSSMQLDPPPMRSLRELPVYD